MERNDSESEYRIMHCINMYLHYLHDLSYACEVTIVTLKNMAAKSPRKTIDQRH